MISKFNICLILLVLAVQLYIYGANALFCWMILLEGAGGVVVEAFV